MYNDYVGNILSFPRHKIHPIFRNFFIPAISVLLITILKSGFISIFGSAPFVLFYLPVIISAGMGGITAGIVATLIASISVFYFFQAPLRIFSASPIAILQISLYFFEGFIISTIIEALHVARENARKAFTALQASQERYKLLVENATDYAIFMIDPKGKVVSWNPGAHKLLGYNEKEIIGKNFFRFYDAEDKKGNRPKKELQEAQQKGRARDDNWVIGKGGNRFWGSGMTMPVRNGRGAIIGFEKIIRDASEEKAQQEKRDDFISIATHELRTPVTSMNAYFSVLEKRLKKEKNFESLHLFDRVDNQLKKLTILIQDLLDVSRIQNQRMAINKELVPIDDIIKESVEDMQHATPHTIFLKGKIHAQVNADRSRISQVLNNLISNAIKYSPEGKRIIVTAEKKGKAAIVGVRDFGIGISKEDQTKVFDRFFRAKKVQEGQTGLGLGLYIAREIIRQHNGTIGVKSTLGKGSTFYIKLPLSQSKQKRYTTHV